MSHRRRDLGAPPSGGSAWLSSDAIQGRGKASVSWIFPRDPNLFGAKGARVLDLPARRLPTTPPTAVRRRSVIIRRRRKDPPSGPASENTPPHHRAPRPGGCASMARKYGPRRARWPFVFSYLGRLGKCTAPKVPRCRPLRRQGHHGIRAVPPGWSARGRDNLLPRPYASAPRRVVLGVANGSFPPRPGPPSTGSGRTGWGPPCG